MQPNLFIDRLCRRKLQSSGTLPHIHVGAERPVPATKAERLLSAQSGDLRRDARNGRDAPISAVRPAWLEMKEPPKIDGSVQTSSNNIRRAAVVGISIGGT